MRSPIAAAVAVSVAACTASVLLLAEPLDPTLPQRVVAGAPAGPAPMGRLTGARDGRSRVPLPRSPRVLWRARVPGAPMWQLAVDPAGNVVVSTTSHVCQLNSRGKLDWSIRIGTVQAATGPMLTSSGERWMATTESEVLSIHPTGRVLWRTQLPTATNHRPGQLLPTADGGAVIPVGTEVFRLDPDGAVREQVRVDEPVETVLELGRDLLLVGDGGHVFRWSPPLGATPIASFGGKPRGGAALAGPNALVAIVERDRLVEIDLQTRTRRVRVPAGPLSWLGPPAVTRQGETRLMSEDGLLVAHTVTGQETGRISLEPGGLADGGAGPGRAGASPPLIVDLSGRVAFIRPGLDVGIADPDGKVVTAAGAACAIPVSVVPAGPGKLAVACHTGLIWLVGD